MRLPQCNGDAEPGKNGGVSPPVLACITHDTLENNELYELVDDFLVIPCSSAEMGKRIKRLALKNGTAATSSQLAVGKITLDLATYQVMLAGSRVDLAWLEFQLLKFLMEIWARYSLGGNFWPMSGE